MTQINLAGKVDFDIICARCKKHKGSAVVNIRKVIGLALAVLAGLSSVAAERVDFSHSPLTAGRASFTETGYVEQRTIGVARMAPELTMPIELVYDSSSEKTGAFGFAWRSPQLESSAAVAKLLVCFGLAADAADVASDPDCRRLPRETRNWRFTGDPVARRQSKSSALAE